MKYGAPPEYGCLLMSATAASDMSETSAIALGPWGGTTAPAAGTDLAPGEQARPTCPYCRQKLLAREDVRYERYGTWVNVSIIYCGKCGAVLGGAAQV
jgi:ribosomal protein L37AE/L43A